MSVILRIDVDGSYQNRILHYARVNQELFLGVDSLGYLEFCKKIVGDLDDRGIKASIFFQPFTVPNKEFAQSLEEAGHSVGLHAVHTNNYNNFLKDLSKISKKFNCKIQGFTKHGSGMFKLSRRHDNVYDPERYIKYATKSSLSYFLGNGECPDEKEMVTDGVLYFPSAFWLNRNYREDRFSINWLADVSENRDIIVIMHPEDVISGTKLLMMEYEKMLDNVRSFKTIDDVLAS